MPPTRGGIATPQENEASAAASRKSQLARLAAAGANGAAPEQAGGPSSSSPVGGSAGAPSKTAQAQGAGQEGALPLKRPPQATSSAAGDTTTSGPVQPATKQARGKCMTQLRVMYFDKKEPVACTVALACPSLLHRNSYMQRIFGALEPLQPLAYLTVPDMTTPALTEIIWAAGQPNKLELLRFCFDPCSFRCDGTVPDDMPPPLHAAIMEKSLSASDQVGACLRFRGSSTRATRKHAPATRAPRRRAHACPRRVSSSAATEGVACAPPLPWASQLAPRAPSSFSRRFFGWLHALCAGGDHRAAPGAGRGHPRHLPRQDGRAAVR